MLHEQSFWWTQFSQFGQPRRSPVARILRVIVALLFLAGAPSGTIWTVALVGSLVVIGLTAVSKVVGFLAARQTLTGYLANHAWIDYDSGEAVCTFWLIIDQRDKQGVKVILTGQRAEELYPSLLKDTQVCAKGTVHPGRDGFPLLKAKAVHFV